MTRAPGSDVPLGTRSGDEATGGGVVVGAESGVVVLSVWGCLDAEVGAAVRAAAADAVSDRARRLDIDLRRVVAFTPEGAVALRDCRDAVAGLQEGLHYRTGRGPGRQALLAAYTPCLDWDGGDEPVHP